MDSSWVKARSSAGRHYALGKVVRNRGGKECGLASLDNPFAMRLHPVWLFEMGVNSRSLRDDNKKDKGHDNSKGNGRDNSKGKGHDNSKGDNSELSAGW
ncbi:MAG: hypothetical protein ACRD3K_12870 [Edaphobacter sp.]